MMLDKKFWQSIDSKVVARYREAIYDNVGKGSGARDVFDNPYQPYKKNKDGISEYAIKKQRGTIKRQKASFKDSTAPVLTGDLFNDFKLRKTDNEGFTFGTTSWGGKVKNLERLGRVISSDKKAIPDKVVDYIVEQAEAYGEKVWKRQGGGKNIIIDIKV